MSKVSVTASSCWEWQGGKFRDGYGQIRVCGKTKRAHRIAYEAFVGPIPAGKILRHTCDNPPCVNPEHLVVGTHKENTRDILERHPKFEGVRRGLCPQGHAIVRYPSGQLRCPTCNKERDKGRVRNRANKRGQN